MPRPSVMLNSEAQGWLRAGFDELAQLLAVTLGPTQGSVLIERADKPQPELLTDAATIARRIISLRDRRRDVGAMLLRQAVWRTGQRVGDGTAVTAVLARALLQEAAKMVAAGANPIQVQRGVRQAIEAARSDLLARSAPAHSMEMLTAVAQNVTGRRDLGLVLGELFDLLGEDAHIIIEDYTAPTIERTYLDGGRWTGKLISPYMQTTPISKRAVQTNCRIALYSERLHDAEDVEPLLELVLQSKQKRLLLVGTEIGGSARDTLILNHTSDDSPLSIAAVSLGIGGARGESDLHDLALLTGATVLGSHIGTRLRHIRAEQLGFAGRVEAGGDFFVVAQGGGSRARRQAQIGALHQQLVAHKVEDDESKRLRLRLGRLSGKSAVLKIGASTKAERTALHQKAEQGVRAMAATVRGGVVVGGGLSLFRCRGAVEEQVARMVGDERMGGSAVVRALAAPALQIMKNAGVHSPAATLARLEEREQDCVFNVLTGAFENGFDSAILDPTPVIVTALESAASAALLALSVDAIVLHKKPELSYEP